MNSLPEPVSNFKRCIQNKTTFPLTSLLGIGPSCLQLSTFQPLPCNRSSQSVYHSHQTQIASTLIRLGPFTRLAQQNRAQSRLTIHTTSPKFFLATKCPTTGLFGRVSYARKSRKVPDTTLIQLLALRRRCLKRKRILSRIVIASTIALVTSRKTSRCIIQMQIRIREE